MKVAVLADFGRLTVDGNVACDAAVALEKAGADVHLICRSVVPPLDRPVTRLLEKNPLGAAADAVLVIGGHGDLEYPEIAKVRHVWWSLETEESISEDYLGADWDVILMPCPVSGTQVQVPGVDPDFWAEVRRDWGGDLRVVMMDSMPDLVAALADLPIDLSTLVAGEPLDGRRKALSEADVLILPTDRHPEAGLQMMATGGAVAYLNVAPHTGWAHPATSISITGTGGPASWRCSPEDLRTAVEAMVADPVSVRRLQAGARQYAVSSGSWERVAQRLMRVLGR